MIEEALTRFPGVYRRSDSRSYQFGLRAPDDLAGHYPGGWAVRCSLKTADLREANEKARRLHQEWADRLARQRAGAAIAAPPPIQTAPDLGWLRATILARIEAMLDRLDARVAGYSPEKRKDRAEDLRWNRDDTQQGLECGYVPDWQTDWLSSASAKLGLPRSAVVDSELLKWYVSITDIEIEALRDPAGSYPVRAGILAARRKLLPTPQGSAIPHTPSVPAVSAPKHYVEDALSLWIKAKPRNQKTAETFARHAAMFAEMTGNPPVNEWTRATARDFRDRLTTWAHREGKTARTADNVRVSISAIAEAARDSDWIAINPFSGFAVTQGGKESVGREPWTHAELAALFDDPIWSERRLPPDAKAGAEAAYWMPLIACYTGARLSEIAQLWTDDLDTDAGAECFEFRENAERGQKLKNRASWRAVPMHSDLVRLGLPAYAKSLPLGPLFPKVRTSGKNGPGGVFGGWFGTFKASKGFNNPAKTFHSFRHLVSTELQLKNVSEALRNPILGHTGEGMGEKVYGATIRRNAQALRRYVNLLDFPLASLPQFWR